MTDIAAPLMVKRPPPANETVRRLKAIKPGERVRYYSGNPLFDLGGAPEAYKTMINEAFDCAKGLMLAKRVELCTEKRSVRSKGDELIFVTDFIAVGK